jgi:hypothetical protein
MKIEVEGGMLSKLGHDKSLLILSPKLNNGCVRRGPREKIHSLDFFVLKLRLGIDNSFLILGKALTLKYKVISMAHCLWLLFVSN